MKIKNNQYIVRMNGGRSYKVKAASARDAENLCLQYFRSLIDKDDKDQKEARKINVSVDDIELCDPYTATVKGVV